MPLLVGAIAALFFSQSSPWISKAAANVQKDVLTTATDLTTGASYLGGGTPGVTWDVTFTNSIYSATTFTVGSNLGIGTLNDLNSSQALIVTNSGGGNRTLTLNGGGNTVPGSNAADLIFVTSNGSLTIQSGSRNLGLALAADGNFNVGTSGLLGISSIISGNFNLAKVGAGMLTLSGTNTFGGAGKTFTLAGGTLNINAAAALGNASNTFVISGGTTINNTSGAAITTSNYAVAINGDFTFAGGGTGTARNLNLGTGSLTLGTSAGITRTITTTASNSTLTLGKAIANGATANSLIKEGAGILTFSGNAANTYTGNTTVNAGTLILGKSANVNAIAGGTLLIGDSAGGNDSDVVQLGAAGQIANTVNVDVRSSGEFDLNGNAETIAALTLESDTMQGATVTTGAGSLVLGGNVTVNAIGTGAVGADFTGSLNLNNAARTFTVGDGAAANAFDFDINGVISSTAAASGLIIKAGLGTMRFSGIGANTYTGLTTVNSGELLLNKSAGVLAIAGNLTIGDGAGGANGDIVKLLAGGQISSTAAVVINASSGKLDLNGFAQTIGSLADGGAVTPGGSSVNLGAGTLTLGDATSTTFSGAITGSGGSLVKQGAGMLTLAGTNTYSGTTTINAGTLQLKASNAFPTSGNLVMLGGTLDISGQSPAIGNITFGNGTGTAATSLTDSGAVKGKITLTGDVLYNGTGSFTFPPGLFSTNIELAAGMHSLNNPNSIYSSATTYDLVFSGVLSGPGGITKDGPSNSFWIAFNAQNTYTGATHVTAGRLYLGVANAVPSQSAVTVSAGASLILNPPVTQFGVTAGSYNQNIGSLAGAGSVTLGSATLTSGNDGTSTVFSGVISGTGAFVKTGIGTQTLSGANTYTAGTTLSGGTVIAGNNAALSTGTVTFNGGGLASDNAVRTLANTILVNNVAGNQINGSNNLTLTGAASGAGTLGVNMSDNTKTVTVNPATANLFAPGALRLTSGTLILGGADKSGDATALTMNGGTLNTAGFSETLGAMILTSDSSINFGTTNNVRLRFSTASWTGGTLTITNWTGVELAGNNPDQFQFSSGPISSDFLSHISFQGFLPGAIAFDRGGGLYEIVPIPEPTTIFGALTLVGLIGFRERRRLSRAFSGSWGRSARGDPPRC